MILTGEAGWKVLPPVPASLGHCIWWDFNRFMKQPLVSEATHWSRMGLIERKTSMRPPWLEVILCCFCLRAGGCDDHGFASTFCFCPPRWKILYTTYDECNATIWLTRVGGKRVSIWDILRLSQIHDSWLKEIFMRLHASVGRIRMQWERKTREEGFGLAPSAPILTAQEMTALIVRIGDIHDDLNILKLGATLHNHHNLKGTWWNP